LAASLACVGLPSHWTKPTLCVVNFLQSDLLPGQRGMNPGGVAPVVD
jgi:hypothetical protein